MGCELTLIPKDPAQPPVRVGAYESQVLNGVLTQVQLTEATRVHAPSLQSCPQALGVSSELIHLAAGAGLT